MISTCLRAIVSVLIFFSILIKVTTTARSVKELTCLLEGILNMQLNEFLIDNQSAFFFEIPKKNYHFYRVLK